MPENFPKLMRNPILRKLSNSKQDKYKGKKETLYLPLQTTPRQLKTARRNKVHSKVLSMWININGRSKINTSQKT